MSNLTPKELIKFAKDYDYEIYKSQAKEILELLDEAFGIYTSREIVMGIDFIVNGQESGYADYF